MKVQTMRVFAQTVTNIISTNQHKLLAQWDKIIWFNAQIHLLSI